MTELAKLSSIGKSVTRALLVSSILASGAAVCATPIVDVLVVYTPGSEALYGTSLSTKVNQLFQTTNQIYADSGINAKIRLVGMERTNYTDDNDSDTALRDITFNREYPVGSGKFPFANIKARRDATKADMVIFYRPYRDSHGSCGLAWILDFKASADATKQHMYSHVANSVCGDYVTAHELGHNMGLNHSRRQDGKGAAYPYAVGHGVDGVFTTIMAYTSAFNVDYWAGKVYKFSNPDIVCRDGLRCGVSRTDTVNSADARYTLNQTIPKVASFYSVTLPGSTVGKFGTPPTGSENCYWQRTSGSASPFSSASYSLHCGFTTNVVSMTTFMGASCALTSLPKPGYGLMGSGCNTLVKKL